MTVEQLKGMVRKYNPKADLDLLEKSYRFSRLAHRGQYRVSGEDYIEHPLAVAAILAELELDIITLVAALLHDVVEDTGVTLREIQAEFGDEVTLLVDGVTKLGRLEWRTQEEEQVENLRKMFLAMARDIRVILIKLADRLHNLRTLKHLPPERQADIARETLEIFAPLAHRLGIFRMKWELEDSALRFLEPERYRELLDRVAKKRGEREEYINEVISILRDRLTRAGIRADIQGRPKHFYSIYKKMYEQGKDFSEIYDLIAVRVIVDTVKDCYGTLGIVHTLWKPIPGRFKDFVAMPKPNMYQSIHTTVMGPHGDPFEIQIRTVDMHRTAEYGIAAHWKYKEGGKTNRDFDEKLSWLRQILEWQHDLRDAREFMESLRIDLFDDEVFVFTPKGDVVDLPAGASPIDFAYRIHTDIGHQCVGARVNGRIVPLDYQLKNGDIVEILTGKQSSGPSWDWLNIVKTSNARNKIRQWFRREQREENIEKGRDALEREARRLGHDFHELWRPEWVEEIAGRFSCRGEEDIFLAVGCGVLSPYQVVNRLREEYRKEKQQADRLNLDRLAREVRWEDYGRPSDGVRVKGIDNVLVRFSRCCNPIPGDAIIGYVTRGRGVSIHRLDCPNMGQYMNERERVIEVAWDRVDAAYYPVEIAVSALDRPGLLSDVARVVAETQTNILFARARTDNRNRRAHIDLVLEIQSVGQLSSIAQRISRIRDVLSVDRVVREQAR